MNTKIKIAFLMVGVLMIGIVSGAMLNRALMHNRIRRTFAMRNPVSFTRAYMNVIRPDTGQEKALKKILDNHAKKMAELRGQFAENTRALIEDLQKKMDALLTPEQKKRLEERPRGPFNRMKPFPQKKGPRREKRNRTLPRDPRL